jgi:hypothetical protein
MKKLLHTTNKLIMKYLGFLLYPTTKLGKEEKNKNIHKIYE